MEELFVLRGFLLGLALPAMAAVAQQPIVPNLLELAERKQVHFPDRTIEGLVEGNRKGWRVSPAMGEWPALLPGVRFANGTIEFDIRGKDEQGQNFVGIAFHAVDTTTYDAVYFRPFNFRVADSARHAHSIQYVSHPEHPWQQLRSEFPGHYEKPLNADLDPNDWFHVRIVVAAPTISVFVGSATKPALVVDKLSTRSNGGIGFWIGNATKADFANLTIRPR
jgi:hypothetical protein